MIFLVEFSFVFFFQHSDYQSLVDTNVVVRNDIAVIRLSERVQRSSTNDWICLPFDVELRDQDVLKIVSYHHIDEESIQEQINVRILNNVQTQSECQRELTDLAEDAFCTRSLTNSSYLGVVRRKKRCSTKRKQTHFSSLGRFRCRCDAFQLGKPLASRRFNVETRPFTTNIFSHDERLGSRPLASKFDRTLMKICSIFSNFLFC